MKKIDILKALLWSLAILTVNVAISVGVIAVYSLAIAPGHDAAFYDEAAKRIAPWSSVVFGGPLFFVTARFCGRRRPERNAFAFATAIWAFYAAIDLTILLTSNGILAMLGIVTLSLATKLGGALAGAVRRSEGQDAFVTSTLSAPRRAA
jgi:hypothetical protein